MASLNRSAVFHERKLHRSEFRVDFCCFETKRFDKRAAAPVTSGFDTSFLCAVCMCGGRRVNDADMDYVVKAYCCLDWTHSSFKQKYLSGTIGFFIFFYADSRLFRRLHYIYCFSLFFH